MLVLGVLWDLALVWPGWELLDPLASIRSTLAEAPPHDVFILLAHLDVSRAQALAAHLPECDLLILGHHHLVLESPSWVGHVPIVQAGHRGEAVGIVTLTESGLANYTVHRQATPVRPRSVWPAVVLLLLVWVLWPRS